MIYKSKKKVTILILASLICAFVFFKPMQGAACSQYRTMIWTVSGTVQEGYHPAPPSTKHPITGGAK